MKKTALCFLLAACSVFLAAQSVSLNAEFGVNGKIVTGLYGISGNPYGIDFVGLPNGSVILGGRITGYAGLEKYDIKGALDTSFLNSLVGAAGFEVGVTIQKDGKILLVCENTLGNTALAARFDTLGNLDASFGNGGIAQTFVIHFLIHNIFEQSDGKVVVFGDEYGMNISTFSAVRFLPNGTIDSSFANNGKLTIDLPDYEHEVPVAMLEQPDKRLVFAGSMGHPIWNIFLLRINQDGSRDSTFGEDGMVIDPIHGNSNAYGLALQSDGKIVISGDTGPDNQAIVVRYNLDGTRDTGFGEQGVQYFAEANEGVGIAIKPDGKILSANWVSNSTLGNIALTQLLPNGQRDPSFGVNGVFKIIDPGMRPRALLLIGNKAMVSARKNSGSNLKNLFCFILDLNVGILNSDRPADPSLLAYPNPIAEQFNLKFGLAKVEQVSIHLFDIQGKQVQSLVQNQVFEPGEHTLSLSCPSDLPTGNYLLTLEVAGKKMTGVQIMKK